MLIIGSGLAGIRAAIQAREAGCKVLVVSKAPTGRANNTAVAKGFIAVSGGGDPRDSRDQHLNDTLAGGCRINDAALVSVMVENLKDEAEFLLRCGVPLAVRDDGSLSYIQVPGHSFPRTLGTPHRSGAEIMKPLVASAKEMGVWTEQGITVLSLQSDGEGVAGAWGYTDEGEAVSMEARSVILATGGAGRLYLHTNNVPGTLGLGQAMALSAGLPLVDMEFVQFYPTYLHMPGYPSLMLQYEILICAAGATLRNCYGEDIREIYGLLDPASLTRDRLSQAIASEIRGGRGVGLDGQAVTLDLSTISGLEEYRFLIPKVVPQDALQLNVTPVVHFTMGGVAVTPGGGTGIPGLWAIGEVAGGIHGANRLGSNSLAECLAIGRVAGGAAAAYAARSGGSQLVRKAPEPPFDPSEGAADLSSLESALRKSMSNQVGILRDAGGLQENLDTIKSFRNKLAGLKSLAALKLGMMVDVAEAISLSALMRRESRGSHFRLEFPDEREEFTGNCLVRKIDGELKIKFIPRDQ